jgi:hypothetical protein
MAGIKNRERREQKYGRKRTNKKECMKEIKIHQTRVKKK